MTIHQTLSEAITELKNHNIIDAEASARLLLGCALKLGSAGLLANLNSEMDESANSKYRQLIVRRAQHEPVAYIIGSQPFCGLSIAVNNQTLIPRTETEQLVGLVVDYAKTNPIQTIIEVGTGSGAISLALADQLCHLPSPPRIVATDISPPAIALAHHNKQLLNKNELIELVEADLLKPADPTVRLPKPDIIVANLPYIPSSRIDTLQPEVRDYEPRLALDGGPDGFDCYRQLFKQIKELSYQPQAIFCEINETHRSTAIETAKQYWSDSGVEFIKDLNNLDRLLVIKLL